MPQKLLDHRPTMMPPFCNSNSSPKIENSTKKSSPETPPESPIKIDKLSLLWNTFDFFPFLIREQFETPNDFKLCLQLVRILGIRTTRQMFPGIPDNIIKTVIIYEAYTN